MPQPTSTQVHVDAILTNISVAYFQQQQNFIASRVFPIVPVAKQSDKFFKYTKNDWFRDEAQRRADATESAGGGYNLTTDSYQADVYAFHKDVGDQTRANADAPINVDREATEFVTSRIALKMETQFVSNFFTTGIWGTDSTPTNLWSDYTSSDPIGDVETGKRDDSFHNGLRAKHSGVGLRRVHSVEEPSRPRGSHQVHIKQRSHRGRHGQPVRRAARDGRQERQSHQQRRRHGSVRIQLRQERPSDLLGTFRWTSPAFGWLRDVLDGRVAGLGRHHRDEPHPHGVVQSRPN
jgi:hypothetical protein